MIWQLLRVAMVYAVAFVPTQRDVGFVEKMKNCSRDHSSVVRQFIHTLWRPVFKKYAKKMPEQCPLHFSHDVFKMQELGKLQYRVNLWTCGICGKSFYREPYLDLHMANKHSSVLNSGDQAVCYSDYCDIFRCDGYIENLKALEWENSNLFKLKRLDIFPFLYKYSKDLLHELSLTLSENGEVVDLESTVAGSEDRGSALTIGPPKKMLKEIERSKKVQDSFVVVGSDDSDVLRDPFGLEPKSSKIRTSFTQWLHKRERSRSEDGDGDRKEDDHKKLSIVDGFKNVLEQVSKIFNKTDNNTRIAKDKEEEIMLVETEITRKESGGSRCKIEEMQDRQNRCLGLLDMCLSPLLIEMEDEEYAKIHGLLHKNLCWYLTCDRIDRYSSIKEARAGFVGPNSIQFLIPVIIFLASLIALLSFLVWLCF